MLISVLFTFGCTKGAPSFETLDPSNIPQPLFSGLTYRSLTTATPTATFPVIGECDPRITGLLATVVGVSSAQSLSAISTAPVNVTCATNGKFSFTLTSLNAMGFSISDNRTYEVELRAVTDGGVSRPSVIRVLYLTPKRIYLTSGSTLSNTNAPRIAQGATFKAEVRLGHLMNDYPELTNVNATTMNIKSGANFTMKAGAAASAD